MKVYKKSVNIFTYIFLLGLILFHPFASNALIFSDEVNQDLTLEDLYERADILHALADEFENMEQDGDMLVLQLEHSPITAGIMSASRPGQLVGKNITLDAANTPVLRDIEASMQQLQRNLGLPEKSFGVHVVFREDGLPIRKKIKALHIDIDRTYISVAPIGVTEELPMAARPRQLTPPIVHHTPAGDVSAAAEDAPARAANQASELPLTAQPTEPAADAPLDEQPRRAANTKPKYSIKDGTPARLSFGDAMYYNALPHDIRLNVPDRVGLQLNHFQEIVHQHHATPIRFDKTGKIKEPKPPRTRWQKLKRATFWLTALGALGYGAYGYVTGDWTLSGLRESMPNNPIPFSIGFLSAEVDYDLAMLYEEIAHYELLIEQRSQSTPLDLDWGNL